MTSADIYYRLGSIEAITLCNQEEIKELRGELKGTRKELEEKIDKTRNELHAEIAGVRDEVRALRTDTMSALTIGFTLMTLVLGFFTFLLTRNHSPKEEKKSEQPANNYYFDFGALKDFFRPEKK